MIFLYREFTKSAKKCSQRFNPTSPEGDSAPLPWKTFRDSKVFICFLDVWKAFDTVCRAVARFLCLGGPGACSLGKFLKYRVRDWLKMHFPRFQLGKLDKNESARSLALKFGRLNVCHVYILTVIPY